jgi:Flp pilus assembly protein TadG
MSAAPITASAHAVAHMLGRFARARRAATAVEFALLIPVLAQAGVGVSRLSDNLTAARPSAMVGSTIATDLRAGRTGFP